MISSNAYINIYNRMRRDMNEDKNVRDINRSTPIEFYVEWDRLRMILNPKAKLSQAQLILGKSIPDNWTTE